MKSLGNPDTLMPGEADIAAIKRHVDAYNQERPGIYNACARRAWLIFGGYGMVLAVLLYGGWQVDAKGRFFGAILGLGGYVGVRIWRHVWAPVKGHERSLRYALFPRVFGFIGDVAYSMGREPGFLRDLKQLKLVQYTSSRNDDLISGTDDGMAFSLVETQLVAGSGKNEQVVFKGIVFHFELETEFPGTLVAVRRGGWWQRTMRELWRTNAFEELQSGTRQLDETHDFRSDNAAAARPVIAGSLTSVLMWLANEWRDGANVQIALSGKHGYLMLPTKVDHFLLPHISLDVDYERNVKPLVREMTRLLAVAHVVRRLG